MNRRGQLVILAFLLVVAAYLAVVWQAQSRPAKPRAAGKSEATPTPDVTKNWPTYTNTAPDFSIKYPLGWTVLTQPIPVVISNQASLTSQAPDTKFLLVDSRPGDTLTACYAATNYNQNNYSYTQASVKAGSHSGSRYTIDPKPGSGKTGFATAYLFVKNGRCYDMALASMSAAARNQDADLAQTIAESFKF